MSDLQKQIDEIIALHTPEWHTEYNIPVFDEFDSPTETYERCSACHERLYEHNGKKCSTVAILELGPNDANA